MISIIIPYYNGSKYFEETLNSVYQQSGVNFEVIVVNDGSEPNEVVFLENIQKKNAFILANQANKGVSAARNCGLALAKGEYILFLDADDELFPDVLNKLEKLCNDVVIGNYTVGEQLNRPTVSAQQFIQGNPIQVGSALIRTSVVRNLGGFNEGYGYAEDMDFWFRVWNSGASLITTNITVLKYREHEDSAMKKLSSKLYIDNVNAFKYRLCNSIQFKNQNWYKPMVISRTKTNHWYARQLGWRFILRHYAYLIRFDSRLGVKLILSFLSEDWRYIKVQ